MNSTYKKPARINLGDEIVRALRVAQRHMTIDELVKHLLGMNIREATPKQMRHSVCQSIGFLAKEGRVQRSAASVWLV